MLANTQDKQWEAFAKDSPYYAVSTHEKFRGKALEEETLREFFESGEQHMDMVLRFISDHLDQNFNPRRCLDFGCGVGRLLVPMARKFQSVVGVDISKTMLEEAKLNCQRYGLANVELVESDDKLSRLEGKFDFIHSFIVFQHIACDRGEILLEKLVKILDDNGVAALHFTYAGDRSWIQRLKYWLHTSLPFAHNVANLIRGRNLNFPHVMINRYNLNRLFRIMQTRGCEHCYVRYSNHAGLLGVVLIFQKKSVGIML